jgi:hypothetical protein
MITEFDDFCTWVFVVVDDIWKPIAPLFKRPGPQPECTDSESIAMSLIGECRGWHMETELLSWMSGLILDFELTSANRTDLEAGFELLSEHTDLEVLGDKGYISAAKAAELWEQNRIRLRTIPRSNQKKQVSDLFKHLHNAIRQLIETVNSQLSGQFGIEKNYAHTFWGLCTRLFSKLTAHTLCISINRLLGKPNFLQIKTLTFPI